jgi:hypothetical protein
LERAKLEDILWWAREVCRAAALHEVDEWLKLDGKHVTNPHPELTWAGTEGAMNPALALRIT